MHPFSHHPILKSASTNSPKKNRGTENEHLEDINSIKVYANIRGVRREAGILRELELAHGRGRKSIFFEYNKDYVADGVPLSPFKLKFEAGPIEAPFAPFEGLHGVFADSLPDSWGRLLLERVVQTISPGTILTPLQRLACVGRNGMGALEYEPVHTLSEQTVEIDLDGLADEARNLLERDGIPAKSLSELLRLNGSSGGARPKILVDLVSDSTLLPSNSGVRNSEAWIIKFPCSHDVENIGVREFVWSELAREFGIEMPRTRLFPSHLNKGYFGVQRFDRENGKKIHVATVAGLLHADASFPCIDYENLLKLCKLLTRDMREVKKLARIMVFNVVMNNTDDHAKNFSFLLDENLQWKLAPAYDLAPQRYTVEHMSAVNGKGKNICDDDMVKAASSVGVKKNFMREIIDEMRELAAKEKDILADLLG